MITEAKRLMELAKLADFPSDIRVDEDYLDYGHDAITRPSINGMHRVYVCPANKIDCTTDAARYICAASPDTITKLCTAYLEAIDRIKLIANHVTWIDPINEDVTLTYGFTVEAAKDFLKGIGDEL